jgi:hypothetical protein
MENNGGWVCKAIIFLSAKMTKAKLRFLPFNGKSIWGIFTNVSNIFGLFTTQYFSNSSLLTYSLMENNGGWVCKAIIFLHC